MTIRERLEAARAKGLTDNDLAHWLGVPRVTVRYWRCRGSPGAERPIMEIERRLDLLLQSPSFPMAFGLIRGERKAYIRAAYERAIGETRPVFDCDLARERAPLRHDDP